MKTTGSVATRGNSYHMLIKGTTEAVERLPGKCLAISEIVQKMAKASDYAAL